MMFPGLGATTGDRAQPIAVESHSCSLGVSTPQTPNTGFSTGTGTTITIQHVSRANLDHDTDACTNNSTANDCNKTLYSNIDDNSNTNEVRAAALWGSVVSEPWAQKCLAEDWGRLVFLAPYTKTQPQLIRTHSPQQYRDAILDSSPSYPEIVNLLRSVEDSATLAAEMGTLFSLPSFVTHTEEFWTFVAEFIRVFKLPPAPLKKGESLAALLSKQRNHLKATFSQQCGLGLVTTMHHAAGSPIPHLWGDISPLSGHALNVITQLNLASARSLVKGDDSVVSNILLGPISLINEACSEHTNLVPDYDSEPRVRDEVTKLSTTDWQYAYAECNIAPGTPLSFSYGITYHSENDASDLECGQCYVSTRTRNQAVHADWCSLLKEKWFPLILAEDWVRLNILSYLANVRNDVVMTHSIGATRNILLRTAVPWDEFGSMFSVTRQSRTALAESLQVTFQSHLEDLNPLLEGRADGWGEFWDFAARFIDSLNWEGHEGNGRLSVFWDDEAGFGLASAKIYTGEGPLPKLWGDPVELSPRAVSILDNIDNATTRSLVRGNATIMHVLLGPLSILNHACVKHCNLLQDSETGIGARNTRSGLSETDYRGAHKPLETYAGLPSANIQIGEELTICYSPTATTVRTSGGDCKHPTCRLCPSAQQADDNLSLLAQWEMAASLPFFSHAAADDWFRLNVLYEGAPTAAQRHLVPTFTSTLIREVISRPLPSRVDVLEVFYSSEPGNLAANLAREFEVPFPEGARTRLNPDIFWNHISRFLQTIKLPPNPKVQGPDVFRYSPPQWHVVHEEFSGWKIISTRTVDPEEALDLWSISFPLTEESEEKWQLAGGGGKSLLSFGPGAFVSPHLHRANVIPSSPLLYGHTSGTVTKYEASTEIRKNATIYAAAPKQLLNEGMFKGEEFNSPPPLFSGLSRQELKDILPKGKMQSKGPKRSKPAAATWGWCGDDLTPAIAKSKDRLMRFFTQNIHLSKKRLEANLTTVLRAMHNYDMGIGALTETLARRGAVQADDQGIAERGLTAGGVPINFNSLWSFMPSNKVSGAGVTLVWDARIPFRQPKTDKNGRLAAITLCSPSGVNVRVIGIYAPASPLVCLNEVIELHRDLLNELSFARRNNLAVVVLGDFNDVVQGDLSFQPHDRTYSTHAKVKDFSIINCLQTRGMIDSFRAIHPQLHGATFHKHSKQRPSRLDQIWIPHSWRRAVLPESKGTASVDTGKTFIPVSDHRAVTLGLSFYQVFGTSSEKVRCSERRTTMSKLDLRDLHGEGLESFRDAVLKESKGLAAEVRTLIPCTCPQERVLTDDSQYTIAEEVDGAAKPQKATLAACTCAVAKPPDAKFLLSELMGKWNTIILQNLPGRVSTKVKPKGDPLKAPIKTELSCEAARMRSRLLFSTPDDQSLPQAKADWDALRIKAAEAGLRPVEANIADEPTPDIWAAGVAAECTLIQKEVNRSQHKANIDDIRQKIGRRYIECLLAHDNSPGYNSSFLKRASHDGSTKPFHVQTDLSNGGASTDPTAIKKGLKDTFEDWFSAKKSGPGGPKGSSHRKIKNLYRRPPAPSRSVAHSVTLAECKSALKAAPSDSCPGPTGIGIPLLRLLPDEFFAILKDLFNLMLAWGELPKCFDHCYIFPIPKKGEFKIQNSRPISLLESHLKLLTRIVNQRLSWKLNDEDYFSEFQFGFRPGRSCTDAFHMLLGAVEDSVEWKKEIHLSLIDLTKAFDSLSPLSLQQAYRQAGLDSASCAFLGSMDGTGTAQVLSPWGPTDTFNLKWGVRQGEVLSPLKFITWLNPWLKHIEAQGLGYEMVDENGESFRIPILAFADDIAILASSPQEMQTIVSSLCDFLLYHGVTLSANSKVEDSKTHYVTNAKRYRSLVLHLKCYNRKSTPDCIVPPERIALKARSSNAILVYLGGRISLNLNWSKIREEARASIQRELNRLVKKKLTLCEAMSVSSSVVAGKAGYLLQLGQFSAAMLDAWDAALNTTIRSKARLAMGSSTHGVRANKNIGLGLFSFTGLAQQAAITELLVRLNANNTGGRVARSRWKAAMNACPDILSVRTLPTRNFHFTLYCAAMARKLGCTLIGPQNKNHVAALFRKYPSLTSGDVLPESLVIGLEQKGFTFSTQVWERNGQLKTWETLRSRKLKGDARAAWYEELSKTVALPLLFRAPPRDRCEDFSKKLEHPTEGLLSWEKGNAIFLQEELAKMGEVPEDDTVPPPRHWPYERSLMFFTDGSLNHRTVPSKGGYCSVTPHSIPNWEKVDGQPFSRRSGGVSIFGAEDVSIGTMELMAILDIAENAPKEHIRVYVDASYILNGLKNRSVQQRRITRSSDRVLWLRFYKALDERKAEGLSFRVIKCSSHGKDIKQHPAISLWNTRADAGAKAAAHLCVTREVSRPSGDDRYGLLHRGRLVRGDPRAFIKKLTQRHAGVKLEGLPSDGRTARLLNGHGSTLSKSEVRMLRSPTQMAQKGALSLHQFAFGYQLLALATPHRIYTTDPDNLQYFNPKVDGRNICPFCGDTHPDTWHMTITCPLAISLTTRTKCAVSSLLKGLEATVRRPSGEEFNLLEELGIWLKLALEASSVTFFANLEDMPPGGDIACRVLLGKAATAPDPLNADWEKNFVWPFILCSQSTMKSMRDANIPFRPLLSIPQERFPGPFSSDGTQTFLEHPVVFGLLSKKKLPSLNRAGIGGSIEALARILDKGILWGSHELSLAWKHKVWHLESLDSKEADRVLDEYNLLPSNPLRIPRDTKGCDSNPSLTWLGILPKRFGPKLQALLDALPANFRRCFRTTLSLTILGGQKQVWNTVQDLLIQAWKRVKAQRIAKSKGKPIPYYKPLYADPDHILAEFPPSQYLTNLATRFLGLGVQVTLKDFHEVAPTALGIARSQLGKVWMAVLKLQHTLSSEGVKKLTVDAQQDRAGIIVQELHLGDDSDPQRIKETRPWHRHKLPVKRGAVRVKPRKEAAARPAMKVKKPILARPPVESIPSETTAKPKPKRSTTKAAPFVAPSFREDIAPFPRAWKGITAPFIPTTRDCSGQHFPTFDLIPATARKPNLLRQLGPHERSSAAKVLNGSTPCDIPMGVESLDIRSLRPRKHISEKCMNRLLLKLRGWVHFSKRTIRIESGDTWQIINGESLYNNPNLIRRIAGRIGSAQVTLVTCCLLRHWVLVALIPAPPPGSSKALIFNSLPNLGTDQVIAAFTKYFAALPSPTTLGTWSYVRVPCAMQRDSYNCGVYLIGNLLQFAQNWISNRKNSLWTPNDVLSLDDLRIRAISLLTAGVSLFPWSTETELSSKDAQGIG